MDSRTMLCKLTHGLCDQLLPIQAWSARAEETYRLAGEVAATRGDRKP